MKFGKLSPKHDPRTLKLSSFLAEKLPAPPVAMDWFSGVKSFGMMGNDDLGDCTIAALGHLAQIWTGAMGSVYTPSDKIVVETYSQWCGYVPGDESTDNGGYELDILNKFRQEGFAFQKLLAYVAVNPQNTEHVQQAISRFCGAYIGLALPISAQTQKVWDVVSGHSGDPGSWGLHAVCLGGYDKDGPECITWGARQKMTWAFFKTYCDEAYALLQGDWAKYGSADFFDSTDLQKALAEVTN